MSNSFWSSVGGTVKKRKRRVEKVLIPPVDFQRQEGYDLIDSADVKCLIGQLKRIKRITK